MVVSTPPPKKKIHKHIRATKSLHITEALFSWDAISQSIGEDRLLHFFKKKNQRSELQRNGEVFQERNQLYSPHTAIG